MQAAAQLTSALALSAALLVLVSGVAKLRSPGPAVAMLDTLRAPVWRRLGGRPRRMLIRASGLAEFAIGLGVAVVGGRLAAAALAVLFAAFMAVVLLSLARGSHASCGCFGAADAPIGRAHLGVDVAGLLIAVSAVVRPPARWGGIADASGLVGPVLAVQVALLGWLAYLAITALPTLAGARRRLMED